MSQHLVIQRLRACRFPAEHSLARPRVADGPVIAGACGIPGGVNACPKEIEEVLAVQPAVADVVIFSVPDEEFGEAVKAVLHLLEWPGVEAAPSDIPSAYRRIDLSAIKVVRSFDPAHELPRQENGDPYQKALRDADLGRAGA